MNVIDNIFLNEVEDNYKNNKLNTLRRQALSECKISDLVYVKEQEQYTQNKFSIDLNTLTTLDQGKNRRCWIFAGLDILRRKITLDYNLENFKLSANYLLFYDKLEKCNFFIEKMIELADRKLDDREVEFILRKGIADGGFWQNFVNLVNKYGIVPDYAFPETYQSNNTFEMNQILNKYMRKFAVNIRNKNNIKILKEEVLKNVYNLLCNCLGVPPKTFDFEYVNKNKEYKILKNIKATEFLQKYINFDIDKIYRNNKIC